MYHSLRSGGNVHFWRVDSTLSDGVKAWSHIKPRAGSVGRVKIGQYSHWTQLYMQFSLNRYFLSNDFVFFHHVLQPRAKHFHSLQDRWMRFFYPSQKLHRCRGILFLYFISTTAFSFSITNLRYQAKCLKTTLMQWWTFMGKAVK